MYTISKEADIKVQEDLDAIIAIVRQRLDPVSIILFGGFGKGEGSFEVIDGKVKPLNDYDLYVITKGRVKDAFLEEVSQECSRAIGRGGEEFCEHPHEQYDVDRFFHVDLRTIPASRLKKLKPMQRTFELKESPVVYGEPVANLIPQVVVPVSDAIRLLFNKLHHLLLGRDNDIHIKTIYIYKAYLDICAALLIQEKKFAATYAQRNSIFQKLDYPEELKELVSWATQFRLQPDFGLDQLDERWQCAQKWTLWALKKIVMGFCSGEKKSPLPLSDTRQALFAKGEDEENDWKKLASIMYQRLPYKYFAPYLPVNFFPAQYALNLFYVKRAKDLEVNLVRPLFGWRDAGLILGIAMVLFHAGEYGMCRYYLNKVEKERTELKDQLLELYGLYYSQRIV